MSQRSRESSLPAPLIGVASWVVPGLGYWLIGQRSRALTVGITITILFVLGLLIAGVRSLEVPGWGPHGKAVLTDGRHSGDDLDEGQWVLTTHPLDEIRAKPWSIAQIMAGPLDLLFSVWSVQASQVNAAGYPVGVRSHSHTNEIGVLYTAVAGMLNLLVIIDSAYRAGQTEGQ
jgi:uncharacterized protein DUF6677